MESSELPTSNSLSSLLGQQSNQDNKESERRPFQNDRVNLNDLHRLRANRSQNLAPQATTATMPKVPAPRPSKAAEAKPQTQSCMSSIDFLRNQSAPTIDVAPAATATKPTHENKK